MPVTLRARSAAVLPLLIVAVLVATLFSLTPSADAASRRQKIGNGMDVVRAQKGDPYKYGADGPRAFDCSGLVYYSFRKAGFNNVPRTSTAQAKFMNRIKKKNLRRGDFLYFYDGAAKPSNVYHLGVFAGWKDGRRAIVHAPYGNKRVHRERVWTGDFFAGSLRGR